MGISNFSFLFFLMNWEKIFPCIRKSMRNSFPYLGIVWFFLTQQIFCQGPQHENILIFPIIFLQYESLHCPYLKDYLGFVMTSNFFKKYGFPQNIFILWEFLLRNSRIQNLRNLSAFPYRTQLVGSLIVQGCSRCEFKSTDFPCQIAVKRTQN